MQNPSFLIQKSSILMQTVTFSLPYLLRGTLVYNEYPISRVIMGLTYGSKLNVPTNN